MNHKLLSIITGITLALGSAAHITAGNIVARCKKPSQTRIAEDENESETLEQIRERNARCKAILYDNAPKETPTCSLGSASVRTLNKNTKTMIRQELLANNASVGYIDYNDTYKDEQCTRFIGYILVNREHQGKGIGTECLRQFIDQSEKEGVKTLRLITVTTAKSMYEKAGFISSMDEFGHGMEKTLTNKNPYKPSIPTDLK